MKKNLLIFLLGFMFSMAGISQDLDLTVSGYVFDLSNNYPDPVAGQTVTIVIDSTISGFSYQNDVITDTTGYYIDIISLPANTNQGMVSEITFDSCLGINVEQTQMFFPGPGGIINVTADFWLCDNTLPGCEAFFFYYPLDSNAFFTLTYQFVDVSFGNPTQWTWDFGDGTSSTEQNPVHTFPEDGYYMVCLTIMDDSGTCQDTYCEDVYAGNPAGGWGCENFFIYYYVTNTILDFEGFLLNGEQALSYDWDFGDGTTGSGQYITHEFIQGGMAFYTVCLTTMALDSVGDTCVYTSCQDVWLQNQWDCMAFFRYYPDSVDELSIHFIDLSYTQNGNPPDSWFWEFGDGTSSTEQNPLHLYADTGFYDVCLTITDSAGNCTDTYCEMVPVGYMPPPPPFPCGNFFDYVQDDSLTFTFTGEVFWNGMIYNGNSSFDWDFGDGTTGTGQTVTHTFPSDSAYFYLVCLHTISVDSVTGDTCDAYSCQEVWLNNNLFDCMSWFDYCPDSGLTVDFTGYTVSQYPTDYTWEFGDNTTGTGQSISHTYTESGFYMVTLETYDSTGCYWVSTMGVWVGDPEFNIFGTIYLSDSLFADVGLVHLFTFDTLWQNLIEVETTSILDNGYYEFDSIDPEPCRIYFVQAELTDGSAYFGQYVPTYHLSALYWEEAWPVIPFMFWPADVHMIPGGNYNSGPGNIFGTISELNTREHMEDVQILLLNQNNEPLIYLRSDENGQFDFSDLDYGTYVIYAEIVGINTIPAVITLSEDDPDVSIQIIVKDGEAFLSVPDHNSILISELGEVYPNPVSDNAKIRVHLDAPATLQVTIFNQVGQLVSTSTESLGSGANEVSLNTAQLRPGIHLLRVTTTEGDVISKRFIKLQ